MDETFLRDGRCGGREQVAVEVGAPMMLQGFKAPPEVRQAEIDDVNDGLGAQICEAAAKHSTIRVRITACPLCPRHSNRQ